MKNRQTGKCRQTVCCVATMQTKVFLRSVRCEPACEGAAELRAPQSWALNKDSSRRHTLEGRRVFFLFVLTEREI